MMPDLHTCKHIELEQDITVNVTEKSVTHVVPIGPINEKVTLYFTKWCPFCGKSLLLALDTLQVTRETLVASMTGIRHFYSRLEKDLDHAELKFTGVSFESSIKHQMQMTKIAYIELSALLDIKVPIGI